MTRELKFGRRAALSGKARSLVVFVHGYGADGADLLGLADPLGAHLPDTVFLAPDAPEACAGNAFGRQWFSIPRFDGSSQVDAAVGMNRAADDLNAFLDAKLEIARREVNFVKTLILDYPDMAALGRVEDELRALPPLVFAGEARRLTAKLANAR